MLVFAALLSLHLSGFLFIDPVFSNMFKAKTAGADWENQMILNVTYKI